MINDVRRPLVKFDVENPDHRRWFREYLLTNSWKNCPVQFHIPPEYREVPYYMARKVSEYYLQKDFGQVVD